MERKRKTRKGEGKKYNNKAKKGAREEERLEGRFGKTQ